VTPEGAALFLQASSSGVQGVAEEVGIRGGIAYLSLVGAGSGRRAVVHTPGDRWFSVQVDGGFSWDHFEEVATDDDVRHVLAECVTLATVYVTSGPGPGTVRRRVGPVLTIRTPDGEVALRRSVADEVRAALGLRRSGW
jgi:hypothetical protein